MPRREDQDAFGRGLLKAFEQGGFGHEVIERDDGFVEAIRLEGYFEGPEHWPAQVTRLLHHAKGHVLDLGVGAGRHALALQARGHEVTGIDVSPACIELVRARGLRHAEVCSARSLTPSLGLFDTVLMLGNNLGFLESTDRALALLERLARVTRPEARILGETLDPYGTDKPEHLAYHARNRARGRLGGQIRMRVRWRRLKTPWFDYLFMSLDELDALLAPSPWRRETTYGEPAEEPYGVVLAKR